MVLDLITLSVLAVMLVGAGVWLYFLRVERNTLREGLKKSEGNRKQIEDELVKAKSDLAVAENSLGLQREFLENYKKQLPDTFKSLAGEVLEQTNRRFQNQAQDKFNGQQKLAEAKQEEQKKAIDNLVDPLKKSLDKYEKLVQGIEKGRIEAYTGLNKQVELLSQDQLRLQKETNNLVSALRRPEVRGRWGEIHLKRVAELAGMIENCDFTEQDTIQTEEGRLRPDMTVRLPGDRVIVVDAKTPLDAYMSANECTEEDQRHTLLEKHASHIEGHAKALAGKQYAAQFNNSPDFVVLFIPGKSFLQAALQVKPGLIESAFEKGVVIATPSTLVALLKAVAMGWRERRQTENAQKISALGKELHSRLVTAFGHLSSLGKSVTSTVDHFNKLVGSLESNVLPQARRFEELGADSHKELPAEIPTIHINTRDLKAAAYQPAEKASQDQSG